MKLLAFTALLALSNAFVLPDEQVFTNIAVESKKEVQSSWDKVPNAKEILAKVSHEVEEAWDGAVDRAENVIDRILDAASDTQSHVVDETYETAFDVKGWLDSAEDAPPCEASFEDLHDPPHDGPPHRRPPHHKPPHHGPPHHGRPHKANLTVYELISKSKYTTKLAKLINEYDDLVELLNGTTANFTVFAPTDKAFEKIPKHAPKPSKEFLKKLLTYHVSPEFYPARRVFVKDTIPTALNEPDLGDKPQRLSTQLSLKGLTVNFYSKIIAANIFATNGVIHGIDSLLLPPPPISKLLNLLPGEFSTLLLAFERTGLGEELYNSNTTTVGGTVFAPGNFAFKKLGPGPNAFLFSKHGLKYLKALLKYHLVANQTLYSDAYYGPPSSDTEEEFSLRRPTKHLHLDLPTLLDDRSLPVDITRHGPFISVRVNGYVRVAVKNGIAKDAVIHVPSDVLIPSKKLNGEEVEQWQGGEISVEELKERLAPLVEEDGEDLGGEEEDGVKWEM